MDDKNKKQHKKQFDNIFTININQRSQNALNEYQTKIKTIKDQHLKIQEQIIKAYQPQLKKLEFSTDQQVQSLRAKRLQDILQNKLIMKNKIQALISQYRTKVIKQNKEYELQYLKKYMINSMEDNQKKQKGQNLNTLIQQLQKQNQITSYIPNQLVLKKLAFKRQGVKYKQILLAGIEQNDQQHCVYLKHLLEKFKIKTALTLLPPDLPYFIKTQGSFIQQWSQFLKRPSSSFKFYLNSNPRNLKDIRITKQYLPLMLNSMTKSKTFYQTVYSIMQLNEVNYKYQHQPILSGLKANTIQNVYFCDYPFLKQRQMIALNVKLQVLRELIKQYTYFKLHKKQNFSAELLLPKNVVQKKFNHIIKVAKTLAISDERPIVLICKAQIAQVLAQQWKQSPDKYLQFDYSVNQYFLDLDLNIKPQQQKQVMFIEFIQKLVILDIILPPLIQRYFIKYQSFPFSCRNTIGGKQNLSKVFIIWNHYMKLYKSALHGKSSEKQGVSI